MKDKDVLTKNKLKWQIIAAVAMCVVGAGLMIAGFIVAPIGEIHPSVLTGSGEILTFAGSLFGINVHYKLKLYEHESDSKSNSQPQDNE